MAIRVSREGKGVNIYIEDPLVDKVDHDLVAGCIEAVLECCNSSGCCDGRIAINERCFETVARHNEATRCITSCFGCA